MSNNNNIKLIEITDDIGNCKKGNNDNSILCPICSKNLTGFSENVNLLYIINLIIIIIFFIINYI